MTVKEMYIKFTNHFENNYRGFAIFFDQDEAIAAMNAEIEKYREMDVRVEIGVAEVIISQVSK